MFAACKAALSGLSGQSGASHSGTSGGAGSGTGGGGRASPSDKQVEAFLRALTEGRTDLVAAHVVESRGALLSGPLRAHPARSSAWHIAAATTAVTTTTTETETQAAAAAGGGGDALLRLLLRLHGEVELPAEGLLDLIGAQNKRGQTSLHAAAARGNGDAVRLLLSLAAQRPGQGAGLGGRGGGGGGPLLSLLLLKTDKSGRTALHHAAAAGCEECVRLLLAAAAEADAATAAAVVEQDCDSVTAASAATSRSGSPPPLAASAAPPSGPPSPQPHQQHPPSGSPAAAGSVVSRLAGGSDAAGLTPLHFAAASNCLSAVRQLLAAGASYSAQAAADNLEASMPCNAGWTCLHVAAMRGHTDVAMTVLRHHTSLSSEQQVASWSPGKHCRSSDPRVIPDRRGTTAAALAAGRGYGDLAALLDPATTPLSRSAVGLGVPVGPDGREVTPPAMYVCPITQEVMRDPVVASDGFTYERAAISRWVAAGKLTSPLTNLPLASRALFPNNVIKSAIQEWRQEHKLPDPDAPRRGLGGNPGAAAAGAHGARAAGAGSGGRDPFLAHLRAHGL